MDFEDRLGLRMGPSSWTHLLNRVTGCSDLGLNPACSASCLDLRSVTECLGVSLCPMWEVVVRRSTQLSLAETGLSILWPPPAFLRWVLNKKAGKHAVTISTVKPAHGLGNTAGWAWEAAMVSLGSEGFGSICDTGTLRVLPCGLRWSSCPRPVPPKTPRPRATGVTAFCSTKS